MEIQRSHGSQLARSANTERLPFIAGYTDGGAPYGVMWEEVGIDPELPFEEKVKLYHMQMLG